MSKPKHTRSTQRKLRSHSKERLVFVSGQIPEVKGDF